MVVVTAVSLQKLAHLEVAPGDCVKYGILAIGVDLIDAEALVYQKLTNLDFPIASRVVERCLLQVVLFTRVHSQLNETGEHADGDFLVLNRDGREQQVLVVVVLLVDVTALRIILLENLVELVAVA